MPIRELNLIPNVRLEIPFNIMFAFSASTIRKVPSKCIPELDNIYVSIHRNI